ncbi:MAG: FAD-dependent oxidoreductase [Candidatus Omnitrophica bacterium]|nr:FAD-dependent oxidoreductase [Candidatus Omnitrophota bacterium]MDD5429107.1 FAD-dependent oxidoreductase [Candidatus Omnitrophota bacterium]
MKVVDIKTLEKVKAKGLKKLFPSVARITVGLGTCGAGNNAQGIYDFLERYFSKKKKRIFLTKTGCFGFCAQEPLVTFRVPGKPLLMFSKLNEKSAKRIADSVLQGAPDSGNILCKIEEWDHLTSKLNYGKGYPAIPSWKEVPFFKRQKKIVLRDCGLINPDDIEEYFGVGGYSALFKVLHQFSPQECLNEVKESGLRGRGGAGFPVWKKWEILKNKVSDKKYIVCNADEGDPGAYMNRNELEGDPHMIIEGMAIAGFITGSHEGIIYCRAEYPLAVERLHNAIAQAKRYGVLGAKVLGSDFDFNLHIVEGAGAFVCGEETALIASIEGKSGRPNVRPPFPAEKGIWGYPTNINNVETWANIPVIIAKGGKDFSLTGAKGNSGTKVFSLVGKVKNTGLVELPLGTSLQTLVFDIGGGTGTNKKIKAVQTGGPSGGCIPMRLFNTPIDYESLTNLGTIMGSGGVVVMDEDNCMVDVARYFTEFTTAESCGKCTPCREGLSQILKMLQDIAAGRASIDILDKASELGSIIKDSALCGLGQTGPNPLLTTLKYFRQEYKQHIKDNYCDAGVCQEMFLAPCENSCPLHMNIPAYLSMFEEGRVKDAFESIIRDNPLPASIGRICHFHCKLRCRREDIDSPVAQGEVHRYIADVLRGTKEEKEVLDKICKEKLPLTGKKIVIIGAGPAGLTAAYYLIRLGHKVTVYDRAHEAGGILRWGIPAYRLPRDILKHEIGFLGKLGVKFIFNKKISPRDIKSLQEKSQALIIAAGAYKEISLNIPGEGSSGVFSGSSFLESIAGGRKPAIGKKVVIVGGGNVAIDAARSAMRLGARVTIVYRRQEPDMPANHAEILEAYKEGVKMLFMRAPKRIIGSDPDNKVKAIELSVMKPGPCDSSGRKKPLDTGETETLACDTILFAIGERVDADFAAACGLELTAYKTITADEFTLETNIKKVYAGGDIVTGPGTAVEAMAQGKRMARAIDKNLASCDRFGLLYKTFDYSNQAPFKPAPAARSKIKVMDLNKRLKGFKEVSFGLSPVQAKVECQRCLRCDIKEISGI